MTIYRLQWCVPAIADAKNLDELLPSDSFRATLLSLHIPETSVKVATKADLVDILNKSSMKKKLFPANLMWAGLDLFEPIMDNLEALTTPDRDFAISADSASFFGCSVLAL